MSQGNPYANPSPIQRAPNYDPGYYQPVTSFDIGRVIKAPFESPNWIMNVVWVFVCFILSMVVIGNIVLFGYLAEVAIARTGGRNKAWPDFSIDRFGDYLLRGLWGFLWNLILTIPLMILIGLPVITTIALAGATNPNNGQVSGLTLIVVFVGIAISLVVGFVGAMIMLASMMHATLGNDFLKGANVSWIMSFVSKMSGTVILAWLVMVVISFVLNGLGALACGLGLLVTIPLINLMSADILAQLHDIFVSRGGEPAFDITSANNHIVDAHVLS